jgi:hypothetical protein
VAIERMKTPSSVARVIIRILSPRIAPPVNGLEGSIARTATRRPSSRQCPIRRSARVDFPAPGGPVMPTILALPVRG